MTNSTETNDPFESNNEAESSVIQLPDFKELVWEIELNKELRQETVEA